MTGKKILIVCTTDSMIWNFLVPHIYALQDDGNIVECACSKTGFYMEELQELQKFTIHEIGFYRSPFHIYNLLGLIQLIKLIKSKNYDIIHCHEPVGGALGRIAGKICGKKIFYTAHGFHFFNGAPIINWIVYYPIEKFLARYTDVLITINQEDYSRAKKFKSKYVQYIPGIGIELKKMNAISIRRDLKREELGIPKDSIALLSVGEMIKRKNHETAIRSIAKIESQNMVYLICGTGELEDYLKNLAKELKVEDKILFMGFRRDILEIYKACDVFVFPSYQEGLPVSMMEAMSAGLPIICSSIRGNKDLIKSKEGGYLFEPKDVSGLSIAVNKLAQDIRLRKEMGLNNLRTIVNFDIEKVKTEMAQLYGEVHL